MDNTNYKEELEKLEAVYSLFFAKLNKIRNDVRQINNEIDKQLNDGKVQDILNRIKSIN